MTQDLTEYRVLGRTGLRVSRIGLAGGYKIPAEGVKRAFFDYGVNTFYWERRMPGMQQALRELAKTRREELVIAIQSYDHLGLWLQRSVDKALRALTTDYADILLLGYFTRMPSRRVLDKAMALKESGRVRFIGFTGHQRAFHGEMARRGDSPFDVQMLRYNAAHRGAETEVFVDLPAQRPGLISYTATRWGKLLRADKMPPLPEGGGREAPLSAADCYRFALSHHAVDLCLAGPRTVQELDEGLSALAKGPMSVDELARARRIGDFVHG